MCSRTVLRPNQRLIAGCKWLESVPLSSAEWRCRILKDHRSERPLNTRLAATLVGRRSVLSISQAPRQLRLTRQCDEPPTLGFRSGAAHINPMPHKASLPLTFDLFEYAPTISPPPSASALTAAKPAEAANLSDAQLTEGLANLLGELQRRMEANQGQRPDLEKA